MGASYLAVGWNRQKKLYDACIAIGCLLYLSVFISLNLVFNSQVTGETLLIRSTSTLAVLLLHIILSIGPLCRLNKRFLPLLYNRRHLGVTMFFVASFHGVFSTIQFHALGNINPILSVFLSNTLYGSWAAFPFQALGFVALIIFFLMAITSHDFWLHNLSPRVWKTLHMFVYLAYLLIILHIILGVIQYETSPVFVVLIAIGAATLITLHLVTGRRETRLDSRKYIATLNGFIKVCDVDEIQEDKAKMFCLQEERIAVFKTRGKLFAVNNVCKHQNGPLGEGKIIDGCITCPWHGYQYLPNNGCSPPPFKEKVSTYDVVVLDTTVYVHPKPYDEGTERPGAIIPIKEEPIYADTATNFL